MQTQRARPVRPRSALYSGLSRTGSAFRRHPAGNRVHKSFWGARLNPVRDRASCVVYRYAAPACGLRCAHLCPNRFGDLLAAEKLSGTGKEQPGDCEFTRGELDRLALQTDGMVALAQGIAAHFEQRIDTLRLPRVQQHICAHIKLVRTHRVKYHIIRTRAEAFFQGIWIQKLPDHNDWRAAIRIAFTPDTHRVARCEMTMCGVNDNQVE